MLVSAEDEEVPVEAWVSPVFTLTVVSDGESLGVEAVDVEASALVDPVLLGSSEPPVPVPVSPLADDSPAPESLPVSVPVLSDAPLVAPESTVALALLVWVVPSLSELPLSVDPSDEP